MAMHVLYDKDLSVLTLSKMFVILKYTSMKTPGTALV